MKGELESRRWPPEVEVRAADSVLFKGTLGQHKPSAAPWGEGRQINAEALIFQMKMYYCSLPLCLTRRSGPEIHLFPPTLFLCLLLCLEASQCFAEG